MVEYIHWDTFCAGVLLPLLNKRCPGVIVETKPKYVHTIQLHITDLSTAEAILSGWNTNSLPVSCIVSTVARNAHWVALVQLLSVCVRHFLVSPYLPAWHSSVSSTQVATWPPHACIVQISPPLCRYSGNLLYFLHAVEASECTNELI